MAVRRLAEQQPDSFAFTPENEAWARDTIGKYPQGREASAVIPLLWRAQEQEGWLTKTAIEAVAHMLGMPLIRVLEVATFYTMFNLHPVGRKAHVLVCGTTPCMLCGAGELIEVCKRRIAAHPFELSEDGAFSWEEVECLGACVNAPMVQIGKDTYEDLTTESFEAILDAFAAGQRPEPGPQIERQYSAPATGLTSLTELDFGEAPARRQAPAEPARRAAGHRAGTGADIPMEEPHTAVDETAGGEVFEAEQAREMRHATGGSLGPTPPPEAKQQHAGRPTGTGRSEDEAAASQPTDGKDFDETATTEPRAPSTAERVIGAVEHRGRSGEGIKEAPEARADAAGRRPEGIEAPRHGRRDDLKLIDGIGRVAERKLNDLGIWHLDQIAAWQADEIAWVGAYLGMSGRIERDDWAGQARKLVDAVRDNQGR
ncbi:MAG TPA: NADH-quinone oxidoreductase subunit NuoE [Afifellaceae bacterium]|nr:NADH-quinone oxidoreductase subunit NuoE [Afifellaceae bacterium]